MAEKAAAQNIRWQSELVPVYDYEKKEPTFVLKEYANNERYRRERDKFMAWVDLTQIEYYITKWLMNYNARKAVQKSILKVKNMCV